MKRYVSEIQKWGRNNESAVYDRCLKLADNIHLLLKNLTALNVCIQKLIKHGVFARKFGDKSSILVGSNKHCGLYNLAISKRNSVYGSFAGELSEKEERLRKIGAGGRDPFSYKL